MMMILEPPSWTSIDAMWRFIVGVYDDYAAIGVPGWRVIWLDEYTTTALPNHPFSIRYIPLT